MRLVILHPTIPDGATLEDQDSLVQVEAISQALRRLGHEPVAMGCGLDLDAVRRNLIEAQPDVVFNLVESLLGTDRLQYMAAGLLDALGWPYTGAPTEAIFQTTHKLLAKQLLHLAGLPTPSWLARCEADNNPAGICLGRAAAVLPSRPALSRPFGNMPRAAWTTRTWWPPPTWTGCLIGCANRSCGADSPGLPSNSSRGGSSTCRCWAATPGQRCCPARNRLLRLPARETTHRRPSGEMAGRLLRVSPYAATVRLLAGRRKAPEAIAAPGQGVLEAVRAAWICSGRFPRRPGRAAVDPGDQRQPLPFTRRRFCRRCPAGGNPLRTGREADFKQAIPHGREGETASVAHPLR